MLSRAAQHQASTADLHATGIADAKRAGGYHAAVLQRDLVGRIDLHDAAGAGRAEVIFSMPKLSPTRFNAGEAGRSRAAAVDQQLIGIDLDLARRSETLRARGDLRIVQNLHAAR